MMILPRISSSVLVTFAGLLIDEDGFNWGFKYVIADLHNERPFMCVASRSTGQDFHQLKAIFPPSTEITTLYR